MFLSKKQFRTISSLSKGSSWPIWIYQRGLEVNRACLILRIYDSEGLGDLLGSVEPDYWRILGNYCPLKAKIEDGLSVWGQKVKLTPINSTQPHGALGQIRKGVFARPLDPGEIPLGERGSALVNPKHFRPEVFAERRYMLDCRKKFIKASWVNARTRGELWVAASPE